MTEPSPTLSLRRYDLDWLRVLAFSLLIFYHVGMFFNYWEWHIKNNELSRAIQLPMRFSNQWRMSLLFMISGAGVYFALGKRSVGTFLRERTLRIFLPLAFGMFVVVPPQIYFERLTQGETYSYLEFYQTVFQFQPYPQGSFSWHHLWYLTYIFMYSLVGVPLLLYLRRCPQLTARWAAFFSNPFWLISLPVLWHWLGQVLLGDRFPTTHDLIHDWNEHFHYFTLFVSGFVLCTQPRFWDTLVKWRWLTLGLAGVLTTSLYVFYWVPGRSIDGLEATLYLLIRITNSWCTLLAIFGLGYKYLRFSNGFLAYANEAVYPFYILHQTIIVALAYPIIHSPLSIGAKFGYLVVMTFLSCWVLYHFLIRRINMLRVLFGMKAVSHKPRPTAIAASV